MDSTYDLMEVLNHIDPSDLEYQDWINVGMALQHEGYSVDVWDRWSMNDQRYHA
ncbi:PriCT-2 domain-containing protein, partial [Lacrimispora sp.]|uniref:PriCT-2 domain-containing protein n=1 Tax=Lacrimispora sp. TaxID=2719234 RepID=UPI0032E4EA3D